MNNKCSECGEVKSIKVRFCEACKMAVCRECSEVLPGTFEDKLLCKDCYEAIKRIFKK